MPSSRQYVFGEFCLDPGQRALFRRNELVPLTPKSLETLLFLVERHGRIVDKKELLDAVWPDTFVEEVSLARNISVLRKVLSDSDEGQSFIETIPKRGYRFVAPVKEGAEDGSLKTPPAAPSAGPALESAHRGSGALRMRRWLIVAATALGASVLLSYWVLASRPALSFANRDWILIGDFENQTGDPRFDKALLTALTVSFEQSRYANIFPRSRVFETLQRMAKAKPPGRELVIDETLGREICQRENLRALFEAGLTRTGTEYLLTGRLIDPKSGFAVRSYSTRIHTEDQILDALDGLAQSVRRDLGETLYAIRRDTRPLPLVTTASLSALQQYADGVDLWSKGQYLDANKRMLEAVRIDPDFAIAHAALGTEYDSHIFTQPGDARVEYERALHLSNRISERERLFIEAQFASRQRLSEEAIRLYQAYLQMYPDDLMARANLANTFRARNRCDEAIAQYRELIRLNSSDVNSHINIASCYADQRKYAEAVPYYSRALEIQPDRITSSNINREYGFILVGAGQPEKAREVFALGLASPQVRRDALRSIALLDLYEGRYKDAVTQLLEAIKASEDAKSSLITVRNRFYLAQAYAGQGNPAAAIAQLDQASGLDPLYSQATWIAARIGTAYVRLGDLVRAQRISDKLKLALKPDDSDGSVELARLQGEILVAQGSFDPGIALLQKSQVQSYRPSVVLGLESEAPAQVKAGHPEKAVALYESLLHGSLQSPLAWEAQQPWLQAHYELAQLYAAQGNASRAAETVDALLVIWKNADPDLPLYAKARVLRESLNP